MHCLETVLGIWLICLLKNLWLVVSGYSRSKLGLTNPLKACLVAKSFTHEYDIDYEETFTLGARLTFVRTLLAVTTSRQWKLLQIDVKNALLNGDLSGKFYMQPPSGLFHPPDKVSRLRRAFFGLK